MLHRYTNRRRSGAESSNVGGKTALSPGKDSTDYDLVVGGVANDKVFNTVELFFDGLIDKTEAINRLRYEKQNLQIGVLLNALPRRVQIAEQHMTAIL